MASNLVVPFKSFLTIKVIYTHLVLSFNIYYELFLVSLNSPKNLTVFTFQNTFKNTSFNVCLAFQ